MKPKSLEIKIEWKSIYDLEEDEGCEKNNKLLKTD